MNKKRYNDSIKKRMINLSRVKLRRERRKHRAMNMTENARLILGLRAAGWSEKKSMILSFTLRPGRNSISLSWTG